MKSLEAKQKQLAAALAKVEEMNKKVLELREKYVHTPGPYGSPMGLPWDPLTYAPTDLPI